MNPNSHCTFCDPQVEEIQEITRNATMRAVYPWRPIIPEHVMFVPLRHVASLTDVSSQEASGLIELVKQFKPAFYELSRKTGFNVFENDGREAGQHVAHVHFHMFGRAKDEPINPYDVLNNLKIHSIQRLSDEAIRAEVAKLRSALGQ